MANIGAVTLLRSNPLFKGLPKASLTRIAALGRNREYRKGQVVFRQGEPGDALYGIISGAVAISATSVDGRVLRLNTMRPGEVLGEIALLDGGARTATGTMAERGTLFVLGRDAFTALLAREPELAIRLLVLTCERIRWASRLLEESAFLSVRERLAGRLRWLGASAGVRAPDGVEVRISQAELAEWLNVSRQVVNGHLQAWQAAGHVRLARGRVVIRDAAALEAVR